MPRRGSKVSAREVAAAAPGKAAARTYVPAIPTSSLAARPIATPDLAATPPSAPIIAPGRNTWRQEPADAADVIVDAADYYRAFYAAALRARQYILISGWQFDRGVKLLRGVHAVGREHEVRLVEFLDHLCERTPSLRIYILAWDFHMIFALEREWMQRVWFHYTTNERLVFRFDDAVADQGSHHQKFAVLDGEEAFLGGIDLCEARWDDRAHRTENPLRLSRGRPQKPYHDVQVYLRGPRVAGALRDLFLERWSRCKGDPISLDPLAVAVPTSPVPSLPPPPVLPLGPGLVALSRTDPRSDNGTVREVEHLFCDAIMAAERLIYVETQYFSSTRVRDAMIQRMQAPGRGKLDIVVILNERAEAIKEEIAVGLKQAKNLEWLREVAAATGHALGFYYSLSDGDGPGQRATYIHSKLMAVDDCFLTIGSANFTNRSLDIDSELHASWEAEDARRCRAIRRVRVSLLAEHTGLGGVREVRGLARQAGLVRHLDAVAARGGRLRVHGPPTKGQRRAMEIVDPEKLPFDPAPDPDDDAPEPHSEPRG